MVSLEIEGLLTDSHVVYSFTMMLLSANSLSFGDTIDAYCMYLISISNSLSFPVSIAGRPLS